MRSATLCIMWPASRGKTPSSISACVTAPPTRIRPLTSVTVRNSGRPDTSTTLAGRASRRFNMGPNDWLPPIALTTTRSSWRRSSAAARLSARSYSNLAAFILLSCRTRRRVRARVPGRFDRRQETMRRKRRLGHLDSEALQGIVDRAEQHRRRCDATAFAHPFGAELGVGRGRLEVIEADVGYFGRARHDIVGQRGGQRLAELVVRRFLVKRGADALGDTADALALDDHGIDHDAAV